MKRNVKKRSTYIKMVTMAVLLLIITVLAIKYADKIGLTKIAVKHTISDDDDDDDVFVFRERIHWEPPQPCEPFPNFPQPWQSNETVVTLSANEKILRVSGKGSMENYDECDRPDCCWYTQWHFFRPTITDLIIEEGVTHIGNRAFSGLPHLKSITIPNSVTSIGEKAFYRSGYKHLTISKNVTSIGKDALDGTRVSIAPENSHYSFEKNILFNKDKTILIRYSPTFDTICDHGYVIPESVIAIEDSAFYDNSPYSITISKNVASIGWNAFPLDININVVDDNPYYSVEDKVLFNKDKTVLIRFRFDNFRYKIFRDTPAYTIPQSVTAIGDSAFLDIGLKPITIPYGVTSIGEKAFYNSNLTSINIPASVSSIGKLAFGGLNNRLSINVAADNPYYTSQNGILFNKDKNVLVRFPCHRRDILYKIPKNRWRDDFLYRYKVPNSVVAIGDGAFGGCDSLGYIEFPKKLVSIGEEAFAHCEHLHFITSLNPTPPKIGHNAFKLKDNSMAVRRYGSRFRERPFRAYIFVPTKSMAAYKTNMEWREIAWVLPKDPIMVKTDILHYFLNSYLGLTIWRDTLWGDILDLILIGFAIYGFALWLYSLFQLILKITRRKKNDIINISLKIVSPFFCLAIWICWWIYIAPEYFFIYIDDAELIKFIGLCLVVVRLFYLLYQYFLKKSIKLPIKDIILTACLVILVTLAVCFNHFIFTTFVIR